MEPITIIWPRDPRMRAELQRALDAAQWSGEQRAARCEAARARRRRTLIAVRVAVCVMAAAFALAVGGRLGPLPGAVSFVLWTDLFTTLWLRSTPGAGSADGPLSVVTLALLWQRDAAEVAPLTSCLSVVLLWRLISMAVTAGGVRALLRRAAGPTVRFASHGGAR